MSTPSSPLNDKERADLVAYLDGELQGEAARRVEARMAHDQGVRAEADSLKRAWDLLDFLPRPPEASPNFTHRTLEKLEPIRAAGEHDKAARTTGTQPVPGRWARRLLFGAGWAAAVVLAAFLGQRGFNWWAGPVKPGERELVRELRLIENKRLYDAVEDKDELQEIGDIFGDDVGG